MAKEINTNNRVAMIITSLIAIIFLMILMIQPVEIAYCVSGKGSVVIQNITVNDAEVCGYLKFPSYVTMGWG